MSVVVESKGIIKLFIKGADGVIFKRLKSSERRTKLFTQTKQDLDRFCKRRVEDSSCGVQNNLRSGSL